MRHKAVYTTGEAAAICKLSQQTIIRCFDSGQLQGFRVPGSKFRRIPRKQLVKFMVSSNIPEGGLVARIADGNNDTFYGAEVGCTRFDDLEIVDDDAEMVQLFVDVMAADGRFEVATAQTGYDAGVLTQQFSPDVVVLDYMLPDINGNVVCKTIRENPDLSRIKILIISGGVKSADVDALMADGADEFIKKPFNIERVIQQIVDLVEA